jgi:hypothetical protein
MTNLEVFRESLELTLVHLIRLDSCQVDKTIQYLTQSSISSFGCDGPHFIF